LVFSLTSPFSFSLALYRSPEVGVSVHTTRTAENRTYIITQLQAGLPPLSSLSSHLLPTSNRIFLKKKK
jgi:hypothetical protein